MTWWLICFAATFVTIGAKWYFTNGCSRLRHTLSRQQRETLELKGTLTDARQLHQDNLRMIREKEVNISRLKKRITEQQAELISRQAQNAQADEEN